MVTRSIDPLKKKLRAQWLKHANNNKTKTILFQKFRQKLKETIRKWQMVNQK